jgi:hypothetical protein
MFCVVLMRESSPLEGFTGMVHRQPRKSQKRNLTRGAAADLGSAALITKLNPPGARYNNK